MNADFSQSVAFSGKSFIKVLLAVVFVALTLGIACWAIEQTHATEHFFFETADGLYLSGKTYGHSETIEIILLHSAFGESEEWLPLVDAWQSPDWQLTTLDFRGHGQSLGQRDWSQIPQDVAAWLSMRDVKDCTVLIGASFGGNVASQVSHSIDVDGVVLLSPGLEYFEIALEEMPANVPVLELYDVADEYAVFTANAREQHPNVIRISNNVLGHGVKMLEVPATMDLLSELLEANVPCLNQ